MTRRTQASVGAFVLGGILLSVGVVVLFGKSYIFRPVGHASVVFEGSVNGLSIGAPVAFRGVRVGAVEKIDIQYDAKTHTVLIPVTIQIEPSRIQINGADGAEALTLSGVVAQGLRAELDVQSFVTGQSEIGLEIDPDSPAILHVGVTSLPEIPTRKSDVEKVRAELSKLPLREMADNANATVTSLRGLAERLNLDLPPLLASLKGTSDRSTAALERATTAVTEMQARVDLTLGSIIELAIGADRQLSLRGAELHTLLNSSNQTVVQARDMLADLKGLTSDRGAARANLDAVLRDLAAAAASLRGFANDVEHNPQLLVTGRRP